MRFEYLLGFFITEQVKSVLGLGGQVGVYILGKWNSMEKCLENPKDSRAWCSAVYGVAQSRTRLT